VPVGAGAPERLLWTAGSPVQGSDRPLDLALARSPRGASLMAAVMSADDAGQVPPRARPRRVREAPAVAAPVTAWATAARDRRQRI